MRYKNVLLIQTAFIGDVVLTTPMIAAFKKNHPDSNLSVVVKPEAKSILEKNPDISQVIILDKKTKHRGLWGMLAIAKQIRRAGYDLLLSPHQSHRTSILAWLSKIPMRIGYASAGFSKMAYHKRLQRNPELPEIQRLLQFLDDATHSQTQNFSTQLLVHVDDLAHTSAKKLLNSLDCRMPILIAPSSVWETKRWTAFGFADLCRILIKKYNKQILLIGSQQDHPVAQDIITLIHKFQSERNSRMVHNICGKTNLPGLYALMQKSSLLVSNDSAPVHFGCAAKIPVVAIFGPTTPALGYAPIAKNSIVAELDGLDCRPCGTHGAHVCPLKHFRCMKELSPEMVLEKIMQVYGG